MSNLRKAFLSAITSDSLTKKGKNRVGNKSNIRDILPAAERCVLGETGKGGVTAGRQVSMHNEHYQHIMQASTIKGNKLKKKNL